MKIKLLLSVICVAVMLIAVSGCTGQTTATESGSIVESQQQETSNETVSQKNAVRKAKQYLDTMAFSYEGLISQLEFEQFSHDDAVYGVDNCGADWNEQAAKKAKSYLDTMAFSRESLIDQLEFDKFTYEQAVYGVEANGL